MMKKITMNVLILFMLACSMVHAQTFTFPPLADTWIHGPASVANEGASSRLSICPVAGYWIYLKFDVGQLQGKAQDAELRMTRFDGSRPEEISLYVLEGDDWDELTLSGVNRPAPQNPDPSQALIAAHDKGSYDTWHDVSLAEAIEKERKGDGVISLMVREDPDSTVDVRSYYSREGAPSPDQQPRLVVTLTNDDPPVEETSPDWRVVLIGEGMKPGFDFGPDGDIHVMGMTESTNGEVWYARAESLDGPWNPRKIVEGYFYGPGDLRVGPDGSAHMLWHDHDAENPAHAVVTDSGEVKRFPIMTPNSHDGWDDSLAFDANGILHAASIFPQTFGAVDSLQYGVFDGSSWNYAREIVSSGRTMYGFDTSIAIDSKGFPHIAYTRSSNWLAAGDLAYAFMDDDGWHISPIVTGAGRGRFASIALDHWDRPHVAWLDVDPGSPSVGTVRYGVLNSNQWQIEDVDVLNDVELAFGEARKTVSLALDSDYRPHIAYSDKRVVKYAAKPFMDWRIQTVIQSQDDLYKGLTILRLDAQQQPVLCFWQRDDNPKYGLIRMAAPKPVSAARDWRLY